ncbi:hypothetical protein QUF80_03600 [Desulfococcaceae bacterium HSG8]|nr:hypothetical protein [Desulfococcaceae bacterium HSG8]
MSLYEAMKHKIDEKANGCFYVTNDTDGREARIILDHGKIRAILVEKKSGSEPDHNILKWLHISVSFSDKIPNIGLAAIRPIDTERFMNALEKADARIKMVKEVIPWNDAVFRVVRMPSPRFEGFDARKLQISLALKGQRRVSQVIDIIGLTEFEVLSDICWLHTHDLIELVSKSGSLSGEKKTDFLNAFRERLADLIGPAADMVMEDAFETIGTDNPDDLDALTFPMIMELKNAVCQQIDKEEAAIINEWVSGYLKPD